MLASIEHRGRDDQGEWISDPVDDSGNRVCLGHRRLSILDTSPAGHETMFSHDDRYVLTFNGEIYNYRELRDQLRGLNHEFHSDCDAEVLLAAFAQWGCDSLARLNGMFAFAIWDKQEHTLTLARDHVGIKPLYYAHAWILRHDRFFHFNDHIGLGPNSIGRIDYRCASSFIKRIFKSGTFASALLNKNFVFCVLKCADTCRC